LRDYLVIRQVINQLLRGVAANLDHCTLHSVPEHGSSRLTVQWQNYLQATQYPLQMIMEKRKRSKRTCPIPQDHHTQSLRYLRKLIMTKLTVMLYCSAVFALRMPSHDCTQSQLRYVNLDPVTGTKEPKNSSERTRKGKASRTHFSRSQKPF
jgi:hypothetical protein